MIILDTHVWLWWIHDDMQLSTPYRDYIQQQQSSGLGICVISCWEIAKLVEYKRLKLPLSIEKWLDNALNYPGVQLLDLTPRILIESTQLPGEFHRDPADQMIVATARIYGCPLVSMDRKILAYQHVKTQP